MATSHYKIGIFIAGLLAVFLYIPAHAAIVYTASDYGVSPDLVADNSGPCGAPSTNCQGFRFVPTATFTAYGVGMSGAACSGATSTLSIGLRNDWGWHSGTNYVTQIATTTPDMIFVCGFNTYTSLNIPSTYFGVGGGSYKATTPQPFTFTSGVTYFINIDPESNYTQSFFINFFDSSTGQPSISINSPANLSVVVPFAAWVASTTNNPVTSSIVSVIFGNSTSTLYNFDQHVLFAGNTIQYIPRQSSWPALPPNATSELIYAYARLDELGSSCFTNIADATCAPTASSSLISFRIDLATTSYVNNNYELVPGQGIPRGSPLTPEATSTSFCPAPGSWTDIGGGIAFGGCYVANYVFGNSGYSLTFLQTQWLTFEQTPPFSLVFGVVTGVESAATSASSTTSATLTSTMPVGSRTLTLTLLSPTIIKDALTTDTCDATCAQGIVDTLHTYVVNVTWALTGLIALGMII